MHLWAAIDLDGPGGIEPGVEACPDGCEAVEQPAPWVDEVRHHKEQQREGEQHDGGGRDETPKEQRERHVHLVGSPERGSLFFDRLATSPDEGCEESVAQIVVHLFRVPLHADLPSRSHLELFSANTLHGFDHAIFGPGDDAELGARCADRLMVQAVDVPSTCFEDRSQKALEVDVDGVSPGRR